MRLPHLRYILQEASDRGASTGKYAASSDLRYGPKIASAHPKQPPGFSCGSAHEDGRGLQTAPLQLGSSPALTPVPSIPPSPVHSTPR